jgi:hypothetical protein
MVGRNSLTHRMDEDDAVEGVVGFDLMFDCEREEKDIELC